MPIDIAIDTETSLIEPGILDPSIACLTWASSPSEGGLLGRDRLVPFVHRLLTDDSLRIVGHNICFDFGVISSLAPFLLPLIFRKYDLDLIADTMIQEQLLDLRVGNLGWETSGLKTKKKSYALGSLVGGLDKDTWRLRYGELLETPVDLWPEGARKYAEEDAKATFLLFKRQLARNRGDRVTDLEPQCRAAFALQLMSIWGIRTDPYKVEVLENALVQESAVLEQDLKVAQFVRANGTRDLSRVRAHISQVIPSPDKTPKGSVSTSAATLAKSDDPLLGKLSRFSECQKLLSTYVPSLKKGFDTPINASYNVLLKSGRTSCRSPNLQNLPRAAGVRECFVPRSGRLFASVDFDSLEMRTLGQCLYKLVGGKVLLKRYQMDPHFDPHSLFASFILRISYEEGLALKDNKDRRFKDTRQMAKAAGFGFPGGMGYKKFIEFARGSYGVTLSEKESQILKNQWLSFLPEMRAYFSLIGSITRNGNGTITQVFSGRKRGGVGFTDAANGFFQGLASEGTKAAVWNVVKKAYSDRNSPLFGARPLVFIHDEILMSVDAQNAAPMAEELARVMVESMQEFCPDIPITASACLMDCWLKDAEPVYDKNGVLIPWAPKREAA